MMPNGGASETGTGGAFPLIRKRASKLPILEVSLDQGTVSFGLCGLPRGFEARSLDPLELGNVIPDLRKLLGDASDASRQLRQLGFERFDSGCRGSGFRVRLTGSPGCLTRCIGHCHFDTFVMGNVP